MLIASSRRSFLQCSGAFALGPALAGGAEPPAEPVPAAIPSEEYWRLVRRQFAFRESKGLVTK